MPLPEWHERIEALCLGLIGSGLDGTVRLPGDCRWAEYDRSLSEGVLVEDHTLARTESLARDLGVELGWAQTVT